MNNKNIQEKSNPLTNILPLWIGLLVAFSGLLYLFLSQYSQVITSTSKKDELKSLITAKESVLSSTTIADYSMDSEVYLPLRNSQGEYILVEVYDAKLKDGEFEGIPTVRYPNGELYGVEVRPLMQGVVLRDGTVTSAQVVDRPLSIIVHKDGAVVPFRLQTGNVVLGKLTGDIYFETLENDYHVSARVESGGIEDAYIISIASDVSEVTKVFGRILTEKQKDKEKVSKGVMGLTEEKVLAAESGTTTLNSVFPGVTSEVGYFEYQGKVVAPNFDRGTYSAFSLIKETDINLASIQNLIDQSIGTIPSVTFGGSIDSTGITDLSISTIDIANDSITTEKIKNDTIKNEDIATGAINSDKISDDTVTSSDIKDGTITLSDLSGSISWGDINSVSAGDGLTGGGTSGDASLAVLLTSSGTTGSSSSNSGLEASSSGLTLLKGCADGQILKWDDSLSVWYCAADSGGGGGSIDIQEGDVTITSGASFIDFSDTDFAITNSPSGEANIAIDYSNSKIVRSDQTESITGSWNFSNFALSDTNIPFTGGSTTIDVTGAATRTLTITNSDGSNVANLSVEGTIAASNFSGSSSGTNTGDQSLFATIDTPNGTDPVADTTTDTLTFTDGTGITITGTAASDSISIAATLGTSIANSELDNDTIDFDKINSSLTLDEETTIAAGSALNLYIGNNVTFQVTGTGSIIATDLSCTDCIGTTEIADSYLLNTGDTGTGTYAFTMGATDYWLLDGSTTNTGEEGLLHIELNTNATQSGIDITGSSVADSAVDTVKGMNINMQTSTDTDNIYGVLVNNLIGTPTSGSEYGIYQAGTGWDYGIYIEDAAYFATNLTVNSGTVSLPNDQIGADEILSSGQADGECLKWTTGDVLVWDTCGAGGASALDTLTAATTDDTALTSGDNTIEWNWALTSATSKAFTIGENSASTGGSGDQHVLRIDTASGSTAGPLEVVSNSADGGDIEFNLASSGDFDILDNGTAFASFNDDGTVVFDLDPQTSATAFDLSLDGLTTGTGLLIDDATAAGLSSGTLLQVQSVTTDTTAITDGMLGYFNWDPDTTATTKAGDLFRINIAADGTATNLFNVTDAGTSLFRVSESSIESAIPHSFTAAGDVSIAYDLVMTNQTASTIDSYGPLTVRSGESFENNNLTLATYGTGQFVFDNDGTAVFAVKDQGGYPFVNIAGKTDTGDPASCAEGDIYYNDTDDTIKICHESNTWEALDGSSSGPFGSTGGVITKSTIGDYLSLRYGDAGDTQLQIENTTNTTIPTVDAMQIDLTGNTTGIVSDGVDGLQISMEVGNGTSTTNSGLHVVMTPVNSPTGDETIYGANFELSSATSAVETAINIGANWDNAINANGTLISLTELSALDNGIETGDIANGTIDADDLDQATADGSPSDEECLTFETSGGGDFEWQSCGGSSGTTVKIKANDDVASSDVTLNNDSELTFEVGNSENWVFQFNLDITTSNSSTPDFRYDVTAPSSTACRYMHNDVEGATGISNIPCTTSTTWAVVANVSEPLMVIGSIRGVSQGTVALRWAQAVSNATTTTVRAGSSLRAFKTQGADLAEYYNSYDLSLEPGDIVSIDPEYPNGVGVKKSTKAYDNQAIGIISMEPGMALADDQNYSDEGKLVPIGLVGRVPIKVTTENGMISPGDYLTSSSIPGVAMKANKKGHVIGQALIAYDSPDPQNVGTTIAFIRNMEYEGNEADSLIEGLGEVSNPDDLGINILSRLITNKNSMSTDEQLSESLNNIFADRIISGLELITPHVIADSVQARELVITNSDGTSVINFDSNGNAYLKGELVAGKISANQIEGLTLLAEEIFDRKIEENSQSSTQEIEINVLNLLTITGGLKVEGVSEFLGNSIFTGNVTFDVVPTFNKDTGGFALISQGSSRVEVIFDKEYIQTPVVSASSLWDVEKETIDVMEQLGTYVLPRQDFVIANITTKGFSIILDRPAVTDLKFSWLAIAVDNAQTVLSETVEVTPTPTTVEELPAFLTAESDLLLTPTPVPEQ